MFSFFNKSQSTPLSFPKEVEINGVSFKISVGFYSKRSSSASFKGKELNFRLSKYLSNSQKIGHFNSLLYSLKKKIEKKNISQVFSFDDVLSKKKFYFGGSLFFLEFHDKNITKLKENTFYINKDLDSSQIEKKLTNILIKKYSSNLIEYIRYLNSISYNYKIGDVSIKVLNSKWGHCTHKNDIFINLRLLNAPKEVLNYVICHELSHVIEKNHSKSFWDLVSLHCPNYKELRKYLKENPPSLFSLNGL